MNLNDIKSKIHYNSPVVLTFTLISLLVYILGWITKGFTTYFAFTNYRTSLLDPMQYFRFFSHVLGHANWGHFAANFTIILLIGPMVEEKYGSKPLFNMIVITAFVTGVLNTFIFSTGLLGASGIAFMFILLGSFSNVHEGKVPVTFLIILVVFLGREVLNSILTKNNISQFAHIIGGIAGSYFGYFFSKNKALK
ncbi:rhomboid family intramembrane serine protease [Hathewaya histolytica]|uniref:Peptidase S9 prolyl oligopeptidase active site domain-containing protein n=1 Tax=Hathewaya histolytica TaxID=1498 RepID=A0A4U9R0R2_HATHI|nr:rhomboid family intramembrane serine protease [Hathewaya histolytica]VTQ84559.1 peptidase S9 prolyl oligopeptidase active site domain-containing protein [Hathewaya histolytica]